MNDLYRITETERQHYLMLLFNHREDEATAFREACDRNWREKGIIPGENQPVRF